MQYILDLVGQRIRLSVPFELHISPCLTPFLRPAQGETGQFHILVRPGVLPLPDQNCTWHETGYYAYSPEGIQILRSQSRGSAPFAMVELRHDGNIRVTYRPEYVSFLKNAMDLVQIIGLEQLLLHFGSIILHSSFIAKAGKGILFSAPSGTGKSTQARLWNSLRGYEILNGDRAGIRKGPCGWQAWGLPYAGTSGIYRDESAALGAVIVLRQGSENRISRLNAAESIRYLYPETTVHHWDERFVVDVLDILQAMTNDIPVFLLECLPNEDAVLLLEQTLIKEGVL